MPANVREEWDRIYSRPEARPGGEDAWLERWRELLHSNPDAPVLDLGCGAGEDALLLSRWGFRVVAADFSEKALELAGRRAPEAETRHVDITRGLPFPDAHFGAVVASLSLHYFPWQQTVGVLEEVRRCLVPSGHLLTASTPRKIPTTPPRPRRKSSRTSTSSAAPRSVSSTATTLPRCSARTGK